MPRKRTLADGSPIPGKLPPRTNAIYALLEPDEDVVRYIGRSTNPRNRIGSHICQPSDTIADWINELKAKGQEPRMVILATCTVGDAWSQAECLLEGIEQWLIKRMSASKFRRANLLNQRGNPLPAIEVGGTLESIIATVEQSA